jgi:hypothetical protein
MIREAIEKDIIPIGLLAKKFVNETILKDIAPCDVGSVCELIERLIDDPMGIVLVLEQEGIVTGAITGIVAPAYWNNSILMGQQFGWYVDIDKRSLEGARLLPKFEYECKVRGAVVKSSGRKLNDKAKKMDRMLTKRGYLELESSFIGRL